MSDPVARLQACRAQLKQAQSSLEFERKFDTDKVVYSEVYVCRALDEVWAAQIAVVEHLNETIAPTQFWPYVNWTIR